VIERAGLAAFCADRALLWAIALRDAPDRDIRRPLWEFPPEACKAVKHERRRRFKWDIDSEGERVNG
jgi:hypothetical protein